MEFITQKDKKIYTIENNQNNKYLIYFLSINNLLSSVTNDLITFQVDSLNSIHEKLKSNELSRDINIW